MDSTIHTCIQYFTDTRVSAGSVNGPLQLNPSNSKAEFILSPSCLQ